MCRENITAKAGMTARLFCCLAVNNKGAEILWMRSRDVVILSHGTTVFTSDSRVSVHQPGGDGVSELRVRLASLSDSGEYQCSTAQYYDYQAASTTIRLRVEDTLAVIEGNNKHRY